MAASASLEVDSKLLADRLASLEMSDIVLGDNTIVGNNGNDCGGEYSQDTSANCLSSSSSSRHGTPKGSVSSADETAVLMSSITSPPKSLDPIYKRSPHSLKYYPDTKFRKFWGEEATDDAIYTVYLKKITYSSNSFGKKTDIENNDNEKAKSAFYKSDTMKRRSKSKKNYIPDSDKMTKSDQVDSKLKCTKKSKTLGSNIECLQWETRQIRILKAAKLDHLIEYVLLLTPQQQEQYNRVNHCSSLILEEERNNVAHVMHVLFCTYRNYATPYQLFSSLLNYTKLACSKQFRFVLHYWLDNYSEDFITPLNSQNETKTDSSEPMSISPRNSSNAVQMNESQDDEKLVDVLLSLPNLDETIYRKGANLFQQHKASLSNVNSNNAASYSKSSTNGILELDSKFIAQQLTAMDLENFLSLKPHLLLNGSKSNPKVQSMIKDFNLLSKHVIVTILKAQSPDVVTVHWINVSSHLRKMKNFSSLKAVVAGLTNESVYRLKNMVWNRLSRSVMSAFKVLAAIVDDVNNQIILRQTQLELEGTAKVSLKEDSFGTIPYLGTFLTDLNVIDTKYPNYIQSVNCDKLLNIEKCSKQFEILTQIQLLQKNVVAALTAVHQSNNMNGYSSLNSTPSVPRVSRLFKAWFHDSDVTGITDKDCYKLSLVLEPQVIKKH